MRAKFALIFGLMCGSATAADNGNAQLSTTATQQKSIGRPHICTAYYPPAALKAHAEGTVTLAFTITTGGNVKDLRIEKSSNNKDLDDASLQCAAHWLYKPATMDGEPLETPWRANVVWKMPEPTREERWATECLAFRKDTSPIPPGVNATVLTFRVMPDGQVKEVAISHSSGDKSLDEAGVSCTAASHYEISTVTIPPEGLPGHISLDWADVAPPPPPPTVSPPSK